MEQSSCCNRISSVNLCHCYVRLCITENPRCVSCRFPKEIVAYKRGSKGGVVSSRLCILMALFHPVMRPIEDGKGMLYSACRTATKCHTALARSGLRNRMVCCSELPLEEKYGRVTAWNTSNDMVRLLKSLAGRRSRGFGMAPARS